MHLNKRMSGQKALAIFFTVLLIGSFRETIRIFTSDEMDIAANRKELIVIAIGMTFLFLFLTIRYWQKVQNRPKL